MTTRLPNDPIDVAQPYPDPPTGGATGGAGGTPQVRGGDDAGVLVSEERLQVGTEWVPSGTVRVRRRVVSETRTVEVTVRREVLEVEGPTALTGEGHGGDVAAGARRGPDGPLELVLREEVPEVVTRLRPYERVAVSTVLVADEPAAVSDVVRRERVEVSGDVDAPGPLDRPGDA